MSYWVAPIDGIQLRIGDEKFGFFERSRVRLHLTGACSPEVQFDVDKKSARRVLRAIETGKGSFAATGARLEYDELVLRLDAPNQVGIAHWFERKHRIAAGSALAENTTEGRDVFSVMAFRKGVALFNAEGVASWILWREMRSWWLTDDGRDIRVVLPDDILLTVGGEELDRWEQMLEKAGVSQVNNTDDDRQRRMDSDPQVVYQVKVTPPPPGGPCIQP
jgi:hypothetical protein